MKIYCEYCGAQFDSAHNKVCPNCGASFEGNDTIEAEKIKQQKLDELELREQQMEMEARQSQIEYADTQRKRLVRQQKAMNIGCVLPVIIIFVLFTAIFVFAAISGLSESGIFSKKDDIISQFQTTEETTLVDVPTKVGFNEPAEMLNYSLVCDEIKHTDRGGFKPTEGHMYVMFHFVMKNTSDEILDPRESIICSVDGVMCTEKVLFDEKEFDPSDIPVGLSADGYVCFEVPEDSETFELRFGDNITITVENTLS